MFSLGRGVLLAGVLVLGAGCVGTDSYYDWGRYDYSVRALVTSGGSGGDWSRERALLAAEIKRSEENHRRVPPGKHAHLGYLYSLGGDSKLARLHFLAEKTLFPESAVFMDRLVESL